MKVLKYLSDVMVLLDEHFWQLKQSLRIINSYNI